MFFSLWFKKKNDYSVTFLILNLTIYTILYAVNIKRNSYNNNETLINIKYTILIIKAVTRPYFKSIQFQNKQKIEHKHKARASLI